MTFFPAKRTRHFYNGYHEIDDLRNGLIRGIDNDGFRGYDEGRNGTPAVLAVPKKQIIFDIREIDPFTLADHLQISPFRPFFHRRIEKEFDLGIRKNNRSHIASFCDNPSGSGQLSLHREEDSRICGRADILDARRPISSVRIFSETSSPSTMTRTCPASCLSDTFRSRPESARSPPRRSIPRISIGTPRPDKARPYPDK